MNINRFEAIKNILNILKIDLKEDKALKLAINLNKLN